MLVFSPALFPRSLSTLSFLSFLSFSLLSLCLCLFALILALSLSQPSLCPPLSLPSLLPLSNLPLSALCLPPPPSISLLTLSLLSLSLSSFLSLQNKNKTCIPKHRAYHVSGYQKYVGLLRDQDVSSDGRVDELSGVAGNADAQRERRLRDRERAKVGAVAGRAAGELRRVCDLVVIPGLFIYSLGTT